MKYFAIKLSNWWERTTSHWLAVWVFRASLIPCFWFLGGNNTNTLISIITADILFSGAYNSYRESKVVLAELDALAKVHPDVDDEEIHKSCEDE